MQDSEKMDMLIQRVGDEGDIDIHINPQNKIRSHAEGSIAKYLNDRRVDEKLVTALAEEGTLVQIIITPDINRWGLGKRTFYHNDFSKCLENAMNAFIK